MGIRRQHSKRRNVTSPRQGRAAVEEYTHPRKRVSGSLSELALALRAAVGRAGFEAGVDASNFGAGVGAAGLGAAVGVTAGCSVSPLQVDGDQSPTCCSRARRSAALNWVWYLYGSSYVYS